LARFRQASFYVSGIKQIPLVQKNSITALAASAVVVAPAFVGHLDQPAPVATVE
jgi:hypothetical protein